MWKRAGFAALVLCAAGAPSVALSADAQTPACAAALDLILGFAKQGKHPTPLIVAATPDSAETKTYTTDTLLQADWSGSPPPQALADALLSLPAQGVFDSCPGLQAELTKARIASGDDAVARITQVDPDIVALPTYGANVLSLSLPIVSADGRDALVQDSLCQGPNACVGAIIHLQKEKGGRWREISNALSPEPEPTPASPS
jgi:hypothetical protein